MRERRSRQAGQQRRIMEDSGWEANDRLQCTAGDHEHYDRGQKWRAERKPEDEFPAL